MSGVVANVAINLDARSPNRQLEEFKRKSQAASKAVDELQKTTGAANNKLRDASGRFIKAGDAAQSSARKVNLLTGAIGKLGAQLAVADLARRYFKGFNEAEKAAAAVRTLGTDSKVLEQQLLGVSNRLGGLYSQTQLLAASYDVASAGFISAADNAKVLEAAAKGATGGLSDINTVGNAVTSVLNAYGKSANDAAILVDGFIQTQNDGKIILNEYAQQIGKLAPTASAAGIGIEELNAAISTITAQGVPVEATFAGLNQAIVAILKPSKEAQDLAEALGIQFNEAGLRAKGFGGLLDEVKKKTGNSTTALVQLFGGVDALKAILPLVNDDLVKYNKNLDNQAKASGTAEDATRELGGTVSSEINKMVNQIGNLVRALDTVLGPALGGIVKLINVVIAEATKGIQVLGQLFSMSPNTTLAKQAVAAGQLGNVGRVLPGIDELIGEKRRKELQRQAGAGTGLFGLGMDQAKFIELLRQEPAFKQAAPPQGARPPAGVDPRIQAILDALASGTTGAGRGRKGGADKAAREAERLAQEIERSLAAGRELGTQFQRQVLLMGAAEEIEKQRLQIQFDFEDRAKQISELKNEEQRTNLNQLNAEIQRLELIDLQTEALKKQAEEAKKAFDEAFKATEFGVSGGGPIASMVDEMRQSFSDFIAPVNQVKTAAEALGSAFSESFKGIITGTKSAKEAIADFFDKIGQALIDYATQAIAQYIALGVARLFAGVDPLGAASQNLSGAGALSPGKLFPTGVFADGGFVTGPTNALIGEGGEPEYVIPASKMRTAMARYAGGARGDSVVSGDGVQTAAMGGGAATMEPIDVRYSVERINNVDYVTADQFQRGMAQAAQQGAVQGERRALRSLKNSSATRRSVAI